MGTLLFFIIIVLLAVIAYSFHDMKKKNFQLDRMRRLSEIGKKITSNIKIKRLMQDIMETVKKELDAEACTLYLIDEERQELWFEVALGEKGEQLKEIRLKIGEGIAGWVAKEGSTLNIKDVNQDSRFRQDIAKKIEHKQKAMLTMPVKFKGKTVGVLQVINKINGSCFTKQDEELLDGMSIQVAIALENAKLYQDLHNLFVDAIGSLASAVDAKDPYTNGHSKRVTEYSLETGKEMGFSDDELEVLEYMALMHDVGKIGIEDAVLNKAARLTDDEFALMKSHTIIGEKILNSMKSLKNIIPGVKYHHEKFDGSGYFEGLKGKEIPLEARIIAIADTYDAMTTTRPYRKGLDHETAIDEVNKCSGTQFDPDVVKHFIKVMQKQKEKSE